MPRIIFILFLFGVLSCKNTTKPEVSAQEVVDKSIEVSGGQLHRDHNSSFLFRNRKYMATQKNGQKVLKRITCLDSVVITDVRTNEGLTRYINDSLVSLSDSLANRYANSVNSVHYFARLPFGLNDTAVNKTYLGEEMVKGENYHKVKVTFDQQGGGDDFDDTYVYWFHETTFKPDYLAYDFHVNGGGQRFRVAYNERYVNGIRFVDYENYKSKDKKTDILSIGNLYEKGELELLSKIELLDIEVK